ncbi:MAG: sigma-70 family RNA polymerase sigma factor [Clostridia bacterium]|nr:sigma-70 family RNA polymerase sigma factor [Clostridia bacterium]
MSDTQKETKSRAVRTDSEIIDLYFARNEEAIRATDDKYGKYLYTIAYNIVHSREDSEECLDDTYLGTWNAIPPQRPNIFRVFLSRIMRNVAIDRYRETRADKRVPSDMIDAMSELDTCMLYDPTVDEETAICELAEILSRFLRKKSKRERFIFLCRYYYGDPVAHIAALLSVSDRTVLRTLAALREELRSVLIAEGYAVN